MKAVIFMVLVACATYCNCNLANFHCPKVSGVKDFDLARYLGKWYEIERLPNWWQWKGLVCPSAEYSLNADKSGVDVVNSGIIKGLWGYNKELNIGNSSAVPVNGVLSEWALSVGKNVADPEKANYIVLDSDYDNYALIYSCNVDYIEIGFNLVKVFKNEFAWIASRQRTLDPAIVDKLKGELIALGIDCSKLVVSDQNDC